MNTKLLSVVFSYAGVWALTYIFRTGGWINNRFLFSESIMSLMFFVCFYMLFEKVFALLNRRLAKVSCIFGIFYAAMLVCGAQVYQAHNVDFGDLGFYWHILLAAPLCAACTALLINAPPQFFRRIEGMPLNEKLARLTNSKYYLLFLWLLFLLVLFVMFLAVYPGLMEYDFSVYTFKQWLKWHSLSDQHPVADNLFRIFLITQVHQWFGSWEAGVAFLSFVQIVLVSGGFAYICSRLGKLNTPPVLQIACVCFYAFHPFIWLFALGLTKDSLFMVFNTMFVLILCFIALQPQILKEKSFAAGTCVIVLLTLMWRLNAIYSFLLLLPFMFIFCGRGVRMVLLRICLAAFVLFGLYVGVSYSTLSIFKPLGYPSLSLPVQQLGRLIRDKSDMLTDDEKNELFEFLPRKAASYIPYTVEPILWGEFTIPEGVNGKSKYDFLRLWYSLGKKYPAVYGNAFLEQTVALWYPDMVSNKRPLRADSLSFEMGFLGVSRNSKIPLLNKKLEPLYSSKSYKFENIPLISLLFSPGFYLWSLLLYFAICIYYRAYRLLLPALWLAALALSYIFGTVVQIRYVIPFLTALPVLIAVLPALPKPLKFR